MNKNCIICDNEFSKPKNESRLAWIKHICCSWKCRNKYLSNKMKGKMPKNIVAGSNRGMGKKYICIGCKTEFQGRKELHHKKTKYCTRECWLKHHKIELRKVKIKRKKGSEHWNWRGGKTSKNMKIRNSVEYKRWRKSVYTCKECGKRGERLNVDHVKPFAYFPELRLDMNNGRALCENCHKKTDSYLVHRSKKKYLYGTEI